MENENGLGYCGGIVNQDAKYKAARDEQAEHYGRGNRHLKTTKHYADGFDAGYAYALKESTESLNSAEVIKANYTNTGWPYEKKLHERIAELESRNKVLVKALEFYDAKSCDYEVAREALKKAGARRIDVWSCARTVGKS